MKERVIFMLKLGPVFMSEQWENWQLVFNNKLISVEDAYFSKSIFIESKYYLNVSSEELSYQISQMSFLDIQDQINWIFLEFGLEYQKDIELYHIKIFKNKNFMEFEFSFLDWENWKNLYSMKEYSMILNAITEEYIDLGIKWEPNDTEVISNGFVMKCGVSLDNKIIDEVNKYDAIIKDIFEKLNERLSGLKENSLVSVFEFPDMIKVPCQQYLLYFIQFLKELGIEATAELKNEVSNVLFSVKPLSKEVALEKIREALEIFLELPSHYTQMGFSNPHLDSSLLQLYANIQHLQTQIMYTNAIITTQQSTIDNQKIIINQQQQIIHATILQDSLKAITLNQEETDREEVLGGYFAIRKIEKNGIELNTPKLYRVLKEKIFGGKKQ
jgi:hypothetical protein